MSVFGGVRMLSDTNTAPFVLHQKSLEHGPCFRIPLPMACPFYIICDPKTARTVHKV